MKIEENKFKPELKEFVADYFINSLKKNDSNFLSNQNYLCYYLICNFLEEKNLGEISQLIKKQANYYTMKKSQKNDEFIKRMKIKINIKIDSNKTLFEKVIEILENYLLLKKKNIDVQTDNNKFLEFNLNNINKKLELNQENLLKDLKHDNHNLRNILYDNKILREEIQIIKKSNKNFENKQKLKKKFNKELNYLKQKMREEVNELNIKNKNKLKDIKLIYEKKNKLVDEELKKNLNDQKKFNLEFKTIKESLKSKKRILEIEYKKKFENLLTQKNLFEMEKNKFLYDKKNFEQKNCKKKNLEIKTDYIYWEKQIDKLKMEIIYLEKLKKKVDEENEIFLQIKNNLEKENVILMKKNEGLKLDVKEYEIEFESKISIIKELENNNKEILNKNNKIHNIKKDLIENISKKNLEINDFVLDIVKYKETIYNNTILIENLKKKIEKKDKKVVLDEFLNKIDKKTSLIINNSQNINKIDLLKRIKKLKENRKKNFNK